MYVVYVYIYMIKRGVWIYYIFYIYVNIVYLFNAFAKGSWDMRDIADE